MAYWVVGAMYSGSDDQLDLFVLRGIWVLGWSREQKPEMSKLRDQIDIGDRIAVKKMLGQGSPDIEIRALGIVTDVGREQPDHPLYVSWVVPKMKRIVRSRGAYSALQGPYAEDDEWTRLVFQL